MAHFFHYLTFPYLLEGSELAILLTIIPLAGGLLFGLVFALWSGSPYLLVRLPVRVYIYVIRGTPLLLQLIFLYDTLPAIGLRFSTLNSALIALTINETAFCAEILRGGIEATDRHQRLAARALGIPPTTELFRIVLPQALRSLIPTLGNETVGLLKSTSLASAVGVAELTGRSQTIVSQNFEFFPVFLASGVMYIALSSVIGGIQHYLERFFGLDSRSDRAAGRAARPAAWRNAGLQLGGSDAGDRTDYRSALLPLRTSSPAGRDGADASDGARILEVRDLRCRYGAKEVLESMSLELGQGEVVVLMGRSGSGKSTLLKAISALVPVAAGEIVVSSQSMTLRGRGRRSPPERQLVKVRVAAGVGMVFQHFALFDHMTALDNVAAGPRLAQRMPRDRARAIASDALDQVGLSDQLFSLPQRLSGGQQQRVAIARALATSPRLLLFDEPTSALDPELVGEVNHTIRQLAVSGMTMLICTHDVRFANSVADRIMFLHEGRVVEQGPPTILRSPSTPEFTRFLRHVTGDSVLDVTVPHIAGEGS